MGFSLGIIPTIFIILVVCLSSSISSTLLAESISRYVFIVKRIYFKLAQHSFNHLIGVVFQEINIFQGT